jgi:hypothetical protein
MKLEDANRAPQISGQDELLGKSNYFVGDNPRSWRRDVPNYARVRYENVYAGVDHVFITSLNPSGSSLLFSTFSGPGGEAKLPPTPRVAST